MNWVLAGVLLLLLTAGLLDAGLTEQLAASRGLSAAAAAATERLGVAAPPLPLATLLPAPLDAML